MRLLRLLLGVACVVAVAAGVMALWEHLSVGYLLQGVPQGHRLPEVLLVAGASGLLWLCGYGAWHGLQLRWHPALLAGPGVLAALAVEVRTGEYDVIFTDAALVTAEVPNRLVDLLLLATGVALGAGIPTWALLRSRRGTT